MTDIQLKVFCIVAPLALSAATLVWLTYTLPKIERQMAERK